MIQADRITCLAINRLPALKPREKLALAENAVDLRCLASLRKDEVERIIGRRLRIESLRCGEAIRSAREDEKNLTRNDFKCTFYWENDFPPQLREVYDPPFLLFYRGALPDYNRPLVGVVGTRRPSGRGVGAAFRLGLSLGRYQVCVVSGLARGIDCAAHQGNLRGGARTVAVLGNGIDTVYPPSSRRIALEMLEAGGCVMSEYPPGIAPLRYNFPNRNRIISGLSRGVVVVEAPEKSGALITADYALEQGRDLMVHGDGLGGPVGAGSRRLAEDGAKIIMSAEDIFSEWEIDPGLPGDVPAEESHDSVPSLSGLLEEELAGRVVRFNGRYYGKEDGRNCGSFH